MIKFDVSKLTKELHLPILRGVLETKEISFFRRILRFFSFNRKFEVMEDYILWWEDIQKFILIPKTFIYDGASVPKLLGTIYSTVGVLFLGAGPHDVGYRYEGLFLIDPITGELIFQKMSKDELDVLFDELCRQETGMSTATRLAKYVLTIAGILPWKKYRKENHKPENDFPFLYEEAKIVEKGNTEWKKEKKTVDHL